MFWFTPITRSPAQKPACKDLGRNGQKPASRSRPLMFWFMPITRSPAQGSACKDLERDGQERAITFEAAYTPIPNRAGSRSLYICESPQYLLIYVEIF